MSAEKLKEELGKRLAVVTEIWGKVARIRSWSGIGDIVANAKLLYDLVVAVVLVAEEASRDLGGVLADLRGPEKQAAVAEWLDSVIPLPWWAEWADGPIIRFLINLAVSRLNEEVGHDWSAAGNPKEGGAAALSNFEEELVQEIIGGLPSRRDTSHQADVTAALSAMREGREVPEDVRARIAGEPPREIEATVKAKAAAPAPRGLTPRRIFDLVLEEHLRINPLVVAAQTWHETGGYRHCCGAGNSNLAGIKSGKKWMNGIPEWSTRKEILLSTQEYDRAEGRYVTIRAPFRWYGDDVLLCLRDIEQIIRTKPWFADAARNADCCWGYLSGLIARWTPGPRAQLLEPGWATGIDYFSSVAKAMIRFAPELLGKDWKIRLTSALDLAAQRKAIAEDQRNRAAELLKRA